MNTADDLIMAARFAALADVTDDSDWDDVVRRRATHASRRWQKAPSLRLVALLAVLAVVVVVALVAALAAALDVNLVPWNDAPPAAQPIVENFATLDGGAPEGMASGVRPLETRRVGQLAGHTLWVAPGKRAPFCYIWSDSFGGCVRQTWPAIQPSTEVATGKDGSTRTVMVGGNIFADPTSRLELEYDNGTATELPVIWVGPPINAGFFFYNVPADRQPTALVLREANGHELARDTTSVAPPDARPPGAPPLPHAPGG